MVATAVRFATTSRARSLGDHRCSKSFWGSQAAAAGTSLLLAMAACIWAMNLGNASALRLFHQRSAQEATGAAAQITATNLPIISALLLGTNSLLAAILCALLFGGSHDPRSSSPMPWCAELEHGCLGSDGTGLTSHRAALAGRQTAHSGAGWGRDRSNGARRETAIFRAL
jgi:hypothetical protein